MLARRRLPKPPRSRRSSRSSQATPSSGKKQNVPPFMKGTICELTERGNDEPYACRRYGLVGQPPRHRRHHRLAAGAAVDDQGDGPPRLRQQAAPGFEQLGAETILNDPSFAIVRVDGVIPPGARKGDFFDVRSRRCPATRRRACPAGMLFETDLHSVRGARPTLDGRRSRSPRRAGRSSSTPPTPCRRRPTSRRPGQGQPARAAASWTAAA